jgi:two-component system sensor histidine kinase BaeS
MLNTLRRRLIVSHLVPLLIIIPLMGIALVYVLETHVLLPNLANDLMGQARLVSEIAANQPGLWTDSGRAQEFAARISPRLTARLMLLDSSGRLLASSDPADAARMGQPLERQGLGNILAGQPSQHVDYSQRLQSEVADVFMPVMDPTGQIAGVVRLTHRLVNVYELFLRLRYLIVGVLFAGLLLGGSVGWVLALYLAQPLRRVTLAVYQLASGELQESLPEEGPEEIRTLIRSFNSFVERLQTLEQNRRQLLANLTHELGRPLGALHSAIQALVGGADREESLRRELLAGMDDEIARLRRLLENLARLREQLTGTLELARQTVALDTWLAHLLAPPREAARQKGLRWEVTLPSDLPTLDIDPDRLAQAVGNLINNAIKYAPIGGTVSIEAGTEAAQAFIRVSDTGPGIAPEELDRIFMPFYRGHMGRRFPQGMGLGLTIARDLVIAHGGRLAVESTPGQGSRFTIWLSLASPADRNSH